MGLVSNMAPMMAVKIANIWTNNVRLRKIWTCVQQYVNKFELVAEYVPSEKLHIHYENTPIQIYRKFHLQKLKIFR